MACRRSAVRSRLAPPIFAFTIFQEIHRPHRAKIGEARRPQRRQAAVSVSVRPPPGRREGAQAGRLAIPNSIKNQAFLSIDPSGAGCRTRAVTEW